MYVFGMKTVGMTCRLATEPSSPTYVTMVKCVSDQTSHSLPSRYFEISPDGFPSWKQVMRPFCLLAPKLPRKYPVTERSPNFGGGAGATTTGAGVTGESTGAGCSSASFGAVVLC